MSVNHFVLCADGKWRNRRGKVTAGTPPIDPPEEPLMLLGTTQLAYTTLQASLHAVNANATMQVIRRYDGAIPSSWSSTSGQNDVGTGRVSWISFSSPTIAQINSGGHDGTIAAFFASIPPTHRCMVTYLHEIDLADKLGSTPPQDYAAAQARLWNIKEANAQNPANVAVGPVLTAGPYRSGTFINFYPTGGQFDFVGADPYRFWRDGTDPYYQPDPKTGGTGTPRSLAYVIGDPNGDGGAGMPAYAAAQGKSIAIAEYGAHPTPNDPNNRPNWLVQTDAYLRSQGCMAAIYFHSHVGESGPWWLDCYHDYANPQDRSRLDPHSVNQFAALLAAHQA